MHQIAHVLEYYQTKLAWGDAADWPHVHLRERVRHYQLLTSLEKPLLEREIAREEQRRADAETNDIKHYVAEQLDDELEDTERAEAEAYARFLSVNPDWMKE